VEHHRERAERGGSPAAGGGGRSCGAVLAAAWPAFEAAAEV
jgi:hypothetical protein